jgi:hypothetical protein
MIAVSFEPGLFNKPGLLIYRCAECYLISFHFSYDTNESCRDAINRVSTGVYMYQDFCETVLLPK